MNDDKRNAEAIDEAARLGREAGQAAGSWVADGNTSRDGLLRIIAASEDGTFWDIFDGFSGPLSGEWAGDPTPATLAEDLGLADDDEPDSLGGILGEACDAFEAAWYAGFEESAVSTARGFLPEAYADSEAGYGHWHVVSDWGAVSVEDEHRAWHRKGEPCLFCGARSFTDEAGPHMTSSGLPLDVCWTASK